ncbi:hypothetical protein [Mesonia aquimarina]|uniref:hypothetical protein n=1 Tax=Mesonia aquimarina TaxID=1504967 RepID=UPI000EF57E5F|nr:hypothetical protein [Mesonia aquimarina]
MKKILVFVCISLLCSCSKNDVDVNDNNYTFDGKGGIKCKANGELIEATLVISPGASTKDLIFTSYNNENYMSLYFTDKGEKPDFISQSIRIRVFNISPTSSLEGNTYSLQNETNNSYGKYRINSLDFNYSTTENFIGKLEIVYHDIENRILGGRFFFDATNDNGEIVEIRDGEFDMKY